MVEAGITWRAWIELPSKDVTEGAAMIPDQPPQTASKVSWRQVVMTGFALFLLIAADRHMVWAQSQTPQFEGAFGVPFFDADLAKSTKKLEIEVNKELAGHDLRDAAVKAKVLKIIKAYEDQWALYKQAGYAQNPDDVVTVDKTLYSMTVSIDEGIITGKPVADATYRFLSTDPKLGAKVAADSAKNAIQPKTLDRAKYRAAIEKLEAMARVRDTEAESATKSPNAEVRFIGHIRKRDAAELHRMANDFKANEVRHFPEGFTVPKDE